MFWFPFAIAAIFALLGIFSMFFWFYEVLRAFSLLKDQRLWKNRTSTIFSFAFGGTFFPFVTSYVYAFFLPFLGAQLLDDIRFRIIVWYVIGMLLLSFPLWIISFYLRAKAQQRAEYCYFLPQEANLVRLHECLNGMHLAVLFLPNVIKEDMLDPVIRAVLVSTRAQIFPDGKRGKLLLTNDFAVYCSLAMEASIQGYYSMLQTYNDNRALYEEMVPLLNAYPEVDASTRKRLHAIAKQIISGEELE